MGWVVENNKAHLLTWLSSANTEKQVYAADGLLQLKKTGTSLSVDEMRVIDFIINKKGTMFVCSGCSHWHEDITEVTKILTIERTTAKSLNTERKVKEISATVTYKKTSVRR